MDFSVIIPTYNRLEELRRTLEAYEEQETTASFELVVIDDGSNDGTRDFLASYRPNHYLLRLAHQENGGPAEARNHALRLARGRLVLFTGDDIEPLPDLLEQHLQGHREAANPAVAILGLTRWPDIPLTATMRHIDGPGAQQFSYGFFQDGAEYDFRHLYTSNVSLQRQFLQRVDGFSTSFPAAAFEDVEFGHRLEFHGLRILYRQSAVGLHHHPYRASTFYSRQTRCGAMARILFQLRPELAKWLSINEMEQLRLDHLCASRSRRQQLAMWAAEWPDWRERCLRLAEDLDDVDPPGVDGLLAAIFRLGYLEGLAAASWPQATAHRLLADTLMNSVPEAAKHLQRIVRDRRIPLPPSDLSALAALANEPAVANCNKAVTILR